MTQAAASSSPLTEMVPLSARLRIDTQAVHTLAERSGVVRDLLRGTITREAYALYLRNLLPVYRALETCLENRRAEPLVAGFARRELYRCAAIEADLSALHGAEWPARLTIKPAAAAYATLIEVAGREPSGGALVAHAYVRYFGDLSGGQILRRLLARSLQLPDGALSVYDFADVTDMDALKSALRRDLDEAGRRMPDPQRAVDAAVEGFHGNIALSEEIQASVSRAGADFHPDSGVPVSRA